MNRRITQGACSNSLLDLNSLPPVEDSIVGNRLHPIESYSQLPKYVDGGSIDFYVEPSSIECTSLLDSFMYMDLRVIKLNDKYEEEMIEPEDLVSYSPFIAQTIFKSISMKINDEEINESVENYYGYEAYLNSVLHLTRNSQRQILDGAGYDLCQPGYSEVTDPRLDLKTGIPYNAGLSKRNDLAANGFKAGFVSPIIWPLFLVPRVLPTKVELNISFKLNSSEFSLIAHKMKQKQSLNVETGLFELVDIENVKELPTFRIKVEAARLYLQRYRLNSSAMLRMERMLSSGGLYPMTTNKTTSFIMEKNSTQIVRALTLANELPRMCYVFMVERNTLNSIEHSPFNFSGFGIREMYLEADGTKYPSNHAYTPDFTNGRYIKDWQLLQRNLNYANKDLFFDSEGWLMSGYTIFPFNMVPDRSIGCDYISKPETKSGNLNIHLKFEKELPSAICVFVVMEHFRVLKLDSERKPSWI